MRREDFYMKQGSWAILEPHIVACQYKTCSRAFGDNSCITFVAVSKAGTATQQSMWFRTDSCCRQKQHTRGDETVRHEHDSRNVGR